MDSKALYALIGRLATARRKTLDLTQEEVAQRMGISRASLANMEVGRQRLLIHQLYELARALKLNGPEDLLPRLVRTARSDFDQRITGAELSDVQRDQIEGFLQMDVRR